MARFGLYDVCDETVGEFLCAQWERACDALGFPSGEAAASSDLLREVLDPWFAIEIGRECRHPSYVAEDGFPAEISVKWTGSGPELRVLFDIGFADVRPDLAALAATDRLAGRLGAALDDFERVGGMFLDRCPGPPAPLWHSLVLRPGEPVSLKAYFGLYRWGMNEREAAVGAAMEILDMGTAWAAASSGVNTGKHELEFFALDLSDAPQSRAKIYYRGAAATVEELNSLAGLARSHDAARAGQAYSALVGGERGDAGEAPLTCLAFRRGCDRAEEATTYLRVASLSRCERDTTERVAALMASEGVPAGPYRKLVDALAPRPLEAFVGLQELVSYRVVGQRADLTTYFRFPVHPVAAVRPTAGHVPRPARRRLRRTVSFPVTIPMSPDE
ncbi:hypothetical protein ACIGZH_23055 [Streptomyces sp. NPDC058319]|uniref:hypothetical protein n=1 Tax=unclassified Streptomyces TaxID=2593676 RepID=UPI0036EAE625